jgi:HEPN domain-containing protein
MEKPYKPFEEWILQADYDLETAEALLKSGRLVFFSSA